VAKVLFSITDAQLACLKALQAGGGELADADARTVTGLMRRKLIAQANDERRHSLTPQGSAVIALCEMLAIPAGKSGSKRKP